MFSNLAPNCFSVHFVIIHFTQLPKAEASAVWVRLARAAMEAIDVAFAIRVYRHTGNVGMVASLSKLEQVH